MRRYIFIVACTLPFYSLQSHEIDPAHVNKDNLLHCFQERTAHNNETPLEVITSLLQAIDDLEHDKKISASRAEEMRSFLYKLAADNNIILQHN